MPLQDFFHQMHVLLYGYKLFSKLFSSFLLNIMRLTKHDICNIVTHPESIGKFCISVEAHHLCRFGSSPQPWSFQLARTTMLSPRRLMVLGLACVMACAEDEACALQKSAKQTQNSWQLCLFFSFSIWKRGSRAIGAIRRNKPLNHSGAAVWRRVHSRLLFGCQGRPSGIRRSGKRVQSWYKRKQCSGLECLPNPTI